MPRKKLIGLTGPSTFTGECIEAIEELMEFNYVQLTHSKDENLKDWLDQVDGVILAGGIDIHPTIYSESIWNNQNLKKFDIKRDYRELAIIEYCMLNQKPLLGICRGHQLIGLKVGMAFLMDITHSSVCHQPHSSGITVGRDEPCHSIKLISEEAVDRFYKIYKMPEVAPERSIIKSVMHRNDKSQLFVNSFHHQALVYNEKKKYEELGVEVFAIARVDIQSNKHIVEMMQGNRWIGVQFHPEYDFRENTVSKCVLERFKALVEGDE